MATYISNRPSETEALGEVWGRAARSGLVINLSGELGAGKTQLVKGLARGLDITERVHSSTFAIINVYSGGRLRLFHLDLYRLETAAQMDSAGIEEYLNPDGVTVIEWAERLGLLLRSPMLNPRRRQPDDSGTGNAKPEAHPAGRAQGRHNFNRGRLLRFVNIEPLNESTRQITYEDIGD